MREVAIVGVNMLKFGRYPDKDVVRLASEATLNALKDAGSASRTWNSSSAATSTSPTPWSASA